MKKYIRLNDTIHLSNDTELFYTIVLVNHKGEIVDPERMVH